MSLKNVLIFGDSYSTFEGYIPEGFLPYYFKKGREETDVDKVEQTWWYQLMEETGSNLVLNNSWSGSTISYTGYRGDCSETSSFICRLHKLIDADFFKTHSIDTAFVFGGLNDTWANSPIGKMQFSDWEKQDLFSVLPAICYFMDKLRAQLPNAQIICILNTELKEEIEDALRAASERYNAHWIQLKDIDKCSGHPTIKGMAQIKKQVLENLP